MNKSEVLNNIIRTPILFRKRRNVSFKFLLDEAGYNKYQSQISENDIYDALVDDAPLFKSWLHWSEDKRSSDSWYLKKINDNKFIVAYYDSKLGHQNKITYSDPLKACAAFIKKEIDGLY